MKECESSYCENRRAEVVLTRLRIGHCNMTHGYLMTQPHGAIPQCDLCGAELTVKHIIVNCPRLRQIRQRTIGQRNLEEVLGEGQQQSTMKILAFLNQANILEKI